MATSKKQPKHRLTENTGFQHYTTMGFQMLALIAAFVFGGYYLDRWLGLNFPIFTIVLSLAGVFGAMYSIIKRL